MHRLKWLSHFVGYSSTVFLATISGGDMTPVSGPTIIFDEIRIDNGENYNSSSGIYTVPIDGLYEFYSTIPS